MGLDMYLHRHQALYGDKAIQVKKANDLPLREDNPEFEWVEIKTECAYWRKANAIHKWFIDNCGGGDEDRREMEVSLEQLKKLVEVCRKAMQSINLVEGKVFDGYTTRTGKDGKTERVYSFIDGQVVEDATICKKLLPTCAGFFFGSTSYDEYYVQTLVDTIAQLEPIIKDAEKLEAGDVWFEYYASW